jgi:dihydrofolate synthase/folylpolyglutamate synthase
MVRKSLADWLQWQETLNPAEIDLILERIEELVQRLEIEAPPGRVFTVAGTNGKGSCVAVLSGVLQLAGLRVGTYTSPHLCRYNERVAINSDPVGDADLVRAFERIEAVRQDIPLTYFEYGTLAAWLVFADSGCDAWVLEVGLGGRLDAVNALDADFGLITTVDLDHQEWLGDTIEEIAAEKAAILRSGRPLFYGDDTIPVSIVSAASEGNADLRCLGEHFEFEQQADTWSWRGAQGELTGIAFPVPGTAAQLKNISSALAVIEAYDPALLNIPALTTSLPDMLKLPGRFQIHHDLQEWVLDVAHNVQAAEVLVAGLAKLEPLPTTVVLGMMADKNVAEFVGALKGVAARWVVCSIDSPRGMSTDALVNLLGDEAICSDITAVSGAVEACRVASEETSPDGRILVCGSFRVVGPALDWLGLY